MNQAFPFDGQKGFLDSACGSARNDRDNYFSKHARKSSLSGEEEALMRSLRR